MKKNLLISTALFLTLCSAHAYSVPVMIVQLESSAQGIKVLKEEIRDINYKQSRTEEKVKKSGKFPKARSGGWVAQIIRADGTIESEQAIEDPRQQHGEFSYDGATANQRVEAQVERGVFDIQIPISSEEVTLRIVDRQSHTSTPPPHLPNGKTSTTASAGVNDQDIVKGEFKLKGNKQ
ncbi:MAG: hypothetical protein V4732_14800 [Pseudomonadota bacterium]